MHKLDEGSTVFRVVRLRRIAVLWRCVKHAVLEEELSVLCIGNWKVFKHDIVDGFTVSKLKSGAADFGSLEPIVFLALQVAVKKVVSSSMACGML